jgi:two-component system phosphate regulon sensor histidine kinase PhoR
VNREIILAQNKADFVSSVSHELRTPLALISMFAETLLLGRITKEEKKREYFEIIFNETNRLTNIVNRILSFGKIEANKRVYTMEEVDLNKLISDVIRDYTFHLEQNGFNLNVKKSETPLWIKADRDAIYEGVINLIDNAVKYSPEKKEITIEVKGNTHQAWITVKDRGIGIPKDKIDQIFDKFYRATEKDIYKAKGAGLGLTILKHIMDAHNGKIEVDSVEGNGSTFKLIFEKIE